MRKCCSSIFNYLIWGIFNWNKIYQLDRNFSGIRTFKCKFYCSVLLMNIKSSPKYEQNIHALFTIKNTIFDKKFRWPSFVPKKVGTFAYKSGQIFRNRHKWSTYRDSGTNDKKSNKVGIDPVKSGRVVTVPNKCIHTFTH